MYLLGLRIRLEKLFLLSITFKYKYAKINFEYSKIVVTFIFIIKKNTITLLLTINSYPKIADNLITIN